MTQSHPGSRVSGQTRQAEERVWERGKEGGREGEEWLMSVRLGVNRWREGSREELDLSG